MVPSSIASPPDFRDRLIRFWLLQYLQASAGKRTNDALLREFLRHIGACLGREELRDQLSWLERHGCIKLHAVEAFDAALTIAQLTPKGDDVVMDSIEIEGIARRPL
jgi:hypothetical protein